MLKADKIRQGLEVLSRFSSAVSVGVGHDVFYAGYVGAEDLDADDTPSDLMSKLGWFWDSEVECWAIFV